MAKTTGTKAVRRASARERVAAAREAERRRRRLRIIAWTAGGVAAAALATGGALAEVAGHGGRTHAVARPSWPTPADTADRARRIGLSVAPMEGTARHFHTHLDVLVDGRPVVVPAQLGIAPSGQEMSELHTHDTTGVLHIEAPTAGKRYVLGELFTEWGVRLDAGDLGGLRTGGGRTLTAYVDGKQRTGNPADIALTPHREIALVYGPAGARPRVPASYRFAPGL
jgi:hypothetical protein